MRISDWSSDVCSSDLRLFLAGCRLATLEIGGVPAATGQLKTRRRNLLGKRLLAALGADADVGLADLAHDFLLEAATRALIIIDRHINIPIQKTKYRKSVV